MPRVFEGVAGNHPRLNRFDLSYTNTTSMSFGLLYPVQCDECLPGDVFKMSCFVHAEVMPMVAPIMSDIQMFAHTFFVPYRILYGVDTEDGKSIWEKFITGGEDGDYDTPLPAWTPTFSKTGFSSRTIWDEIGNPVYRHKYGAGTEGDPFVYKWEPLVPPSRVTGDLIHGSVYQGLDVCVAPRLAYNSIYNNFYRDENLVDEVADTNEDLLHVAFRKDYFTSALEAQQRGTAPALPVDVNFIKPDDAYSIGAVNSYVVSISDQAPVKIATDDVGLSANRIFANPASVGSYGDVYFTKDATVTGKIGYIDGSDLTGTLSNRIVSAGDAYNPIEYLNAAVRATTFTVSDLRLAFAIQRMQELNMRAGYRYTEWLSAHFNAHPTDARLDRPEYIGGAVINVSVSPLVQQSGTQSESGTQLTPQGTKTGIGHVDTIQKLGNYRVLEHGLIMTLVSIRPKPIYSQGINRQWLRQSRWDFYTCETAFLSEQAVYNAELFINGESGAGEDDDIFGYQAHWNEMRCKNNMVTGAVRDQFDYWTLARKFATRPHLNQDFIEIDENDFNKIFAVQDEDPFIVSWSNLIDAYRPIPAQGVPGLIDHVYGGF